MAGITPQDITDLKADLETIDDVANGADDINGTGLVTPRTGGDVRTLKKVISDIANTDVGAGAAALINARIDDVQSDITAIEDSTEALLPSPSYTASDSTGDRRDNMTFDETSGLLADGDASNLFDGSTAFPGGAIAFTSNTPVAGKYIQWGHELHSLLTEVKWKQRSVGEHGIWNIQGSNDNSTWTVISENITLGQVDQIINVNPGGVYYKFFRLVGVSGNANGSPVIDEIELKIASAVPSTSEPDPLFDMPASLKDKLKSAYAFTTEIGGIVKDLVGPRDIDLSSSANQSYTRTVNGIKLTGGVIHVPLINNCFAQTLIAKINPGEIQNGFLMEGPNGQGWLGSTPDATVGVETKVMSCGNSFESVYDIFEYRMDRGWWSAYHRNNADISTAFAIGGRVASTGSRIGEAEVSAALYWNATLTANDLADLEIWIRKFKKRMGIIIHFDDCHETQDTYICLSDSMGEGVDSVSNLPSTELMIPGHSVLIAATPGGENDGVLLAPYNHWGSAHEENYFRPFSAAKTSPAFGVLYARNRKERDLGPCVVINCGKGSSYVAPSTQANTNTSLTWHPSEIRQSGGLFNRSIRAIITCFAQMVSKGVRPSNNLYFLFSFGLNAMNEASRSPDENSYLGWLQDVYDALGVYFYNHVIKVGFLKAHPDDPVSIEANKIIVRNATDTFISNNSTNVTLINNDGFTRPPAPDGVHDTATRMRDQGIEWHDLRNL